MILRELERYEEAERQAAGVSAMTHALGYEVRCDWEDDQAIIRVVAWPPEEPAE